MFLFFLFLILIFLILIIFIKFKNSDKNLNKEFKINLYKNFKINLSSNWIHWFIYMVLLTIINFLFKPPMPKDRKKFHGKWKKDF